MHVAIRETEDRPMTHGLSERVRLLKREHRLLRGVDLSTDDALAELDRIDQMPHTAKPIGRLVAEYRQSHHEQTGVYLTFDQVLERLPSLEPHTRVKAIQRQYRLETGEHLPISEAIAEADRLPAPRDIRPLPPEPVTEPFPYRRDIALAESKLIDLGYDDDEVALIIGDIRRYGTAWSSFHFHDAAVLEHTEIIEAILSDSPDWLNPQWNAGYVNLGLNAEPIAGTF